MYMYRYTLIRKYPYRDGYLYSKEGSGERIAGGARNGEWSAGSERMVSDGAARGQGPENKAGREAAIRGVGVIY